MSIDRYVIFGFSVIYENLDCDDGDEQSQAQLGNIAVKTTFIK